MRPREISAAPCRFATRFGSLRPDASDRAPRADGVLGVMEFGIARPAALSEIVVRALARDRDRRPRSAAELGAWLERVAVPA